MAERFKLKLSRVIPSLQICRSKHPPVPAIYRLSPVNSKVFDISYPSNSNLPAPPPTTPEGYFFKRHVSTKIVSVECGCQTQELSSEWSSRSPEYTLKKEAALWHVAVSKHTTSPVRVNKNEKKTMTRADSGCYSNKENESETLISSSTRSLSTEIEHSPERTRDGENGRKKKEVNTKMKQIMDYEESDKMEAGAMSPVKTPVFRRTIPVKLDGKVRESVAVVKKSVDPYEDFKRSMLEMILQKQMFEAKDLEQLLFRFLSLNSRKYHEIIVEAFSDIWKSLFCD